MKSLLSTRDLRRGATGREASTNILEADAKKIYRKFSKEEPSLPIFSRDWWLDATVGTDAWNVAIAGKAGQISATMPYVIRRRFGLKVISQPALTQTLGPWIKSCDVRPTQRLAHERELMQTLIDQLPTFDHFCQNWHYSRTNWLPFCWNGFRQTTRYTYALTGLSEMDKLWNGFQHNIRNECRKAVSRFRLSVRDDLPLDAFLVLNRKTFARQGLPVPYREAFVRSLDAACADHSCRKFFIAVDPAGRHHAGLYVVWDENSAYGLMIGSDPDLRTSGAVSLCFWEAIRHAAQVTRRFDFGGSMLQPIERFFRGFGAEQVPYFNVSKTNSMLLRMRQGLLPAA